MDKRNLAMLAIVIASAAMLTLGCTGSTSGTTPSQTPAATAGQGNGTMVQGHPGDMNSTQGYADHNRTLPSGANRSFNGSMERGRNGTWPGYNNSTMGGRPDFNGTYGGPMMRYDNTTLPDGGPGIPQ